MEASPERKKWVLTQSAFDLLLARLDPDRERAGGEYNKIRHRLVRFFEWRGADCPEELADETLNRVAKRVGEDEEIRDVKSYCGGVARMILIEWLRRRERERGALDQFTPAAPAAAESDLNEARTKCFNNCLAGLPAENRDLIMEYYQEDKSAKIKGRKGLAERLGIPLNALRIRAHRIRARLEQCVHECLNRDDG